MGHMEDYIMKLYEFRKLNSEIKFGINRFSKVKRGWIIAMLIMLLVLLCGMIILMFLFPNDFWFLFGLIPSIVVMIVLGIVDAKERKIKINEHIEEYKKQIDLLDVLLKEEFFIDSKEKLTILISKYQQYIEKQNKADEKKNKAVVTFFTALSGVATTFLINLNDIGVDYSEWLNVVLYLLPIVCVASALILVVLYCMKYLNITIQKCEAIINDLEYIKLCKY